MGENAKNALSRGVSLEGKERVYTIEEVLGAGGFGITYKVSATVEVGNIEIDSTFAVKEHFLSEACERDVATSRVKCSAPVRDRVANSLTDFVAEARRLQSIKHPNIVKVSEVFEANDTAYYVMEYIKGSSLRRYIDKNGVLSESQALTVITPILNAINYLHQNRMTHLDIKPDNIMLKPGRDGELTPVLIDFGLSKHYDESGKATSTIRTLGCSDGYAPPEQYAGILTFTPQADVYALGATMFFLMTGIQPEKSTEIDDDYVAKSMPTTISEGTRDAIIHAMNPLRKSRTQSVADYARELGIALDDVTPSSVSSEILTQQIGKPNPGKKDNSTEVFVSGRPKSSSSKWLMPMLIALGVNAVGVIVWLAVGTFNGSDIDSSSSGVDTAQVQEIDSVTDTETSDVVPVEVENETEVAAELEGRYQRDYSAAERMYTQKKYNDCKQLCQSMLNSYPSHRAEINALITKCDSAISAAAQASSSSRLPDKAVDLGLSVYWSDRNVGASSPSDYGGYYAWGETSTKRDYSWDTYQYFHDQDGNGEPYDSNWNTQANELTNIGSNISGSRYDVARQTWGGGWKMPTKSQWEELINRCTWTWTTEGGHSGYKVTGPNGNSIFLPAAGSRYGTSSYDVGSYGYYWSATLYEGNALHAWFLTFASGSHGMSSHLRSYGFLVRPVTEK